MFDLRLILLIFVLTVTSWRNVFADVSSSKAVGYSVIGPPSGVVSSKALGYSVIGPPNGVVNSKGLGYSVIGPPNGVITSSVVVYAVVGPPTAQPQPSIFIFTRTIPKLPSILEVINSDFLHLQNAEMCRYGAGI
ncbi:hypothetical protein [Bdellovibrio sp. HCB-110]|uniref:hypothetical protein n=1 Tax=Bdellovibrio sp. HCB-110 TaxID=3391182 RepID=UPI0039B51C0E